MIINRGNTIYTPKGKAAEYSKWACNFYVGCSNMCNYCYCKSEKFCKAMGMSKPQLKRGLWNKQIALMIFSKELLENLSELRQYGLFFSFSTDPMLDETFDLTLSAASIAIKEGVPVKILTKSVENLKYIDRYSIDKELLAIGVTLTGHNELEPYASSNEDRIKALLQFHNLGYKTFASIEPIIDFESSFNMIRQTIGYCDLYMIGLEDERVYNIVDLKTFIFKVCDLTKPYQNIKVYWKDSVNNLFPIRKNSHPQLVDKNYNLFK